jgi:hypothetical protein
VGQLDLKEMLEQLALQVLRALLEQLVLLEHLEV